mmetsp:Transcript_9388/g.14494  ORF Transcript_9388/g.14494 Transcript_9388/m.14494 type:complete len:187 (+) Transcript_9388:119-679(+)
MVEFVTPQHFPTSSEMENAINLALKDTKEIPSTKQLRESLQSDNPSWKIPGERRVSKYLRKVVKKQEQSSEPALIDDHDDDDESVISTVARAKEMAKSTSQKLKNLVSPGRKKGESGTRFSFLKRKKGENLSSTIDMPTPVDEVIAVENETGTIQENEEESTESPYHDDNNGKKEEQFCDSGCIIL